jgi:DNA invertase Pin-like site-specific DNA recombinase
MAEKKRTRAIRIFFYVSEKERDLIDEKMKLAGIQNREAYLRKMTLDGYVIKLDLSGVNELVRLLRNATNNLNQIARRVNETNNLYSDDIKDLQERYDTLWEKADDIMKKLAEI